MGKAKVKNMQGGEGISSSAAVNSEKGREIPFLHWK